MKIDQQTLENRVSLKHHVAFQLAVFCFWFSIYIYVPQFTVYLTKIGLSIASVGIILGSYGLSQILLRFPLGLFANLLRGRQKSLLGVGFLMGLISGLLLVFFHSFILILIARLLAGVTASMWVTATILYARYFSPNRSSQAMSLLQFLTVFAQFISMMLCSYLTHRFGWSFPFWVGTVASLIGLLFVIVIKEIDDDEVKKADTPSIKAALKQVVQLKELNRVTFLSFLTHSILFITMFGFSPLYASRFGGNGPALDWLICAFFVPHTLASLLLSFFPLADRVSKRVLSLSYLLLIPFLAFVPFSKSLLTLCLLHVAIGLLLGFAFPILLGLVVRVSPPDIKMSAMGYYQSLYAGGIFLGPLVAGKIAQVYSLGMVFYFTAVLAALAFLLLLLKSILPSSLARKTQN
jgi:predicted MFS family arabinose efflux permease